AAASLGYCFPTRVSISRGRVQSCRLPTLERYEWYHLAPLRRCTCGAVSHRWNLSDSAFDMQSIPFFAAFTPSLASAVEAFTTRFPDRRGPARGTAPPPLT